MAGLFYADIETDGLIDEVETFHCAVFKEKATGAWFKFRRGQEKQLSTFLSQGMTLVMHNGVKYDKEALNKLGIDCDNRIIDTLMLSWYLEPKRPKHGLESYGEEFGVPKPPVYDWKNGDIEVYIHRCTEDVRIQELVWNKQIKMLNDIYGANSPVLPKFLDYMELRATILMLKEQTKWKLDVPAAKSLLIHLEEQAEDKRIALGAVMPKLPIYKLKNRPKVYFKKCGGLSKAAEDWEEFCKTNGLSDTAAHHKYISAWKDPQPHYVPEVKDWLFSKGWKPEIFDFKRDKNTGETRQIPQLAFKQDSGIHKKGDMCPAIKRMAKVTPELKALLGYSMINHRKGFVKAMLDCVDADGYLVADVQGFTNTLRSKHTRPLANIPSVRAAYGKEIRSLLTCEEGYVLCGSDMSSLEDRIKHHFQFPLDPEYVKTQMADDFDPHLLIAVAAGLITEDEMNFFKWFKKVCLDKELKDVIAEKQYTGHLTLEGLKLLVDAAKKGFYELVSAMRQVGKGGNYSCQYGAGGATVARTCGVEVSVGQKVHAAYWKLNWSIKAIAKGTTVKKAAGAMWQLNPINGFWYYLKADKDRFSTLAQGSGAYCFDMWIGNMIKLCRDRWKVRLPLCGDFHDEVILRVKKGGEKAVESMMKEAIQITNQQLKLNRELDIDVQFGANYAEIH